MLVMFTIMFSFIGFDETPRNNASASFPYEWFKYITFMLEFCFSSTRTKSLFQILDMSLFVE